MYSLLNFFRSRISCLEVSGCTMQRSSSGSFSISSSWLLPSSAYSGLRTSEYPLLPRK